MPTEHGRRPAADQGDRGRRLLGRRPPRCASWSSSSPRRLSTTPTRSRVEEFDENGDIVLEVRVAEDDFGRVIGRSGRIANAIRTVAKAAATREDRRVIVEILDD